MSARKIRIRATVIGATPDAGIWVSTTAIQASQNPGIMLPQSPRNTDARCRQGVRAAGYPD